MEKINLLTVTNNLKKKFPLLLSTVAALCLFLSPSLVSLLMLAVIFAVVVVVTLLDQDGVGNVVQTKFSRLVAVLIALLFEFMGYTAFKTVCTPSSKIAALANVLNLTVPALIFILAMVGCVVGFYAMYTLSFWLTRLLIERLPEQRKSKIISNLKRNWYFPISATAFFCLNIITTKGYFIGIIIAFMASLVVVSQIPSLFNFAKQNSKWLHVVAVVTSLGICWCGQTSFYVHWSTSSKVQALLPNSTGIFAVVSVIGAVVALPFVYFCVLIFWKEIIKIISDNGLFNDVSFFERVVYIILIIASLVLVIFAFSQTEAFYGTDYYDVIYTSDSSSLVKGNVYLILTHSENDLRQPLFAVFAAPFFGIVYLFGNLFRASASVQAMLTNMIQIVMLFVANFMLTKIMKLNSVKRVCFVLLTSCTYVYLLFILMMEQYIVAYFWLIFCMYLIAENGPPNRIVLWGAGGTLLTSMVLLPFMSYKNPIRNFKEWFDDMIKLGLEFVAVILFFCRFDVVFNSTTRVFELATGFTGRNLTLIDKINQYISFVADCVAAPDAGMSTIMTGHISWQLNPVTKINFVGVVILILVAISAFLNRDKKSSMLAAGWSVFSVVMLVILGWGTKENGLILYALYFGWAFLVLLFQLAEKIEDKLNVKFFVPILSIICAAVLAVVNIPAIMEMVDFAINYFPV